MRDDYSTDLVKNAQLKKKVEGIFKYMDYMTIDYLHNLSKWFANPDGEVAPFDNIMTEPYPLNDDPNLTPASEGGKYLLDQEGLGCKKWCIDMYQDAVFDKDENNMLGKVTKQNPAQSGVLPWDDAAEMADLINPKRDSYLVTEQIGRDTYTLHRVALELLIANNDSIILKGFEEYPLSAVTKELNQIQFRSRGKWVIIAIIIAIGVLITVTLVVSFYMIRNKKAMGFVQTLFKEDEENKPFSRKKNKEKKRVSFDEDEKKFLEEEDNASAPPDGLNVEQPPSYTLHDDQPPDQILIQFDKETQSAKIDELRPNHTRTSIFRTSGRGLMRTLDKSIGLSSSPSKALTLQPDKTDGRFFDRDGVLRDKKGHRI